MFHNSPGKGRKKNPRAKLYFHGVQQWKRERVAISIRINFLVDIGSDIANSNQRSTIEFLSFFFAQQRNGGLETSNDIMCRLIFAFRSRKLGERSWRKIVFLPDDRSISTIQRSKRRRKTRPSTNHVHERVGRRGIRGIQSRETRCVRNKRKKLPLLSLPFPRPWPRFDKKSF